MDSWVLFNWYFIIACITPDMTKHRSIRPRLHREGLSCVYESLAYPSYIYPRQANFSYISLQNLVNRLHAGRVTCLAGSPFFDGRVTLLAGPTFLHMNTFACLAGSTPSRRDNQSMCKHCWFGQRGQFARWSWHGWEGDPLSRENFSLYKQGLSMEQGSFSQLWSLATVTVSPLQLMFLFPPGQKTFFLFHLSIGRVTFRFWLS